MEPQFQFISPDDYEAAFKLQTGCHSYPWSRSQFFDCLTEPYFAVQMLLDDEVVGYYVGLKVSVECTLMDIGIVKDIRGKGLGKELLKHFLRECNKRQAEEAWLEVRMSNTPAINLYTQMQFQEIEVRKDYYPSADGREDAIIMKLTLGQ